MLTGKAMAVMAGSLLHDIGKPLQRSGIYPASEGFNDHSSIGARFIRDILESPEHQAYGQHDEELLNGIIDSVKYHHARSLKNAGIADDSPAYIAYIADNISSGTDRREKYDEAAFYGFDPETTLKSVYNVFSAPRFVESDHNSADYQFAPGMLDDRTGVNFPQAKQSGFSTGDYRAITERIRQTLFALDFSPAYLTSLLTTMEATLSYVPSSTSNREVADISLYDHLKLTSAYGACIFYYLEEQDKHDYRSLLFEQAEKFYAEPFALLVSFDFSGIQDFIYTIHSSGAAKMLRARSYYLELLAENAADTLLERLCLTRANLIYSGGGHAYLLAPNTTEAQHIINAFEAETNDWLLATFPGRVFFATGYAPFTANTVMHRSGATDTDKANSQIASERYQQLYRSASEQIASKKLHRYSPEQIKALNARTHNGRECPICNSIAQLETVRLGGSDGMDVCPLCSALLHISKKIQTCDFSYVEQGESGQDARRQGIPLYSGEHLLFAKDEQDMRTILQDGERDARIRRAYAKNRLFTGQLQSVHLWVGDYSYAQEFSEYCTREIGIRRLGVLRMDVDDLGRAFITGFAKSADGRYNTLSRSATFSRSLSLFFKHYINQLLAQPEYRVFTAGDGGPRKASIIYAGGDDVFVVGAWDDVLEFAVDLQKAFKRYTQSKLSLSAGLGIYPDKFPISVMAQQVADLEAAAKNYNNSSKDALALFSEDSVFSWEEIENEVIGEKYCAVRGFFASSDDRGKAFLYRLLELLREKREELEARPSGNAYDATTNKGKTISFARWAYLLARMEPGKDEPSAQERFRRFTEKLHIWFKSERDSKQLETAFSLYIYTIRKN